MEKNLNFGDVLSNAFQIGLKNFFPLMGALILWIITIWIPYLNVGTTIAINTLPTLLSRGELINPLDIFDQKYRKCMGEYFLASVFTTLIICMGLLFLYIPGIVMAIAYGFTLYLVVDKGKGASEALKLSNKITYGHKWTIFLVLFVISVGGGVAIGIISAIITAIITNTVISLTIIVMLYLTLFPIVMAASGYMYGILASDIEKEL